MPPPAGGDASSFSKDDDWRETRVRQGSLGKKIHCHLGN